MEPTKGQDAACVVGTQLAGDHSTRLRPQRKHGSRDKKKGSGGRREGKVGHVEDDWRAEQAVRQIEWYFSTENLCRDVFLRQHLDEQGFVPIAFVSNFPAVARCGARYCDIVSRLQTQSSLLTVDEANETMRVTYGWEQWLLPNAYGGRGVARYIKLPAQPPLPPPLDELASPAPSSSPSQQQQTRSAEESPPSAARAETTAAAAAAPGRQPSPVSWAAVAAAAAAVLEPPPQRLQVVAQRLPKAAPSPAASEATAEPSEGVSSGSEGERSPAGPASEDGSVVEENASGAPKEP